MGREEKHLMDNSFMCREEKRLQLSCFTLEHFYEPVAWLNNRSEFIYVNQAACDLLGYTKDEFLSLTAFDISSDYTPEIWDKRWKDIKENKKSRLEVDFNTKTGENIPVSISSTYMNYEGKEYICSFAVNISERKKAEKDLRLAFFSLENCYDPVFWIKSNGQMFYTNKAACNLLGYTEEELLSMSVPDVNPNFTFQSWNEHWEEIKSKKAFFSESTLCTKSGETLPVEITASYLTYEEEEYHCTFIRDISERKKHEKALSQEVNWRRSLMDGSRDGIVALDMEGRVFEANPAYAQMLGYTRKELQNIHIWDVDKNFSRDELLSFINSSTNKGKLIEVKQCRKDGTVIDVEINPGFIEFDDRKLDLCICRDITQRKKAEQEFKLASLSLENSSDAIFWKEKDGKLCYVNKSACELLDYSKEELLSMSVSDICPDATKEAWGEYWKKLKRDTIFHEELELRTRNGKICPVEVTANYMNYEGKEFEFASMRDLTERKKYEKALVDEIKGRRNLMEQSKEGIVILYEDGSVFESNQSYARMLGYSIEEMQTMGVWDWDVVYSKDQLLKMQENLDSKGIFLETKQRRKDGTIIDVEINANAVEFADRKLSLCICRDITERKKSENAMIEAKITAEAASRAKDEFLSTMSHELRTPLNSILGFSDILQNESFGEINDLQEEYLSYISKSGKHLLNIINNILDLAKAEAGKMKLNYETVYLSELLDEIRITLEPLATKKNIDLNVIAEMPIDTIKADKTKFKEIFYNLVSNAIKFTPENGLVEINITTSGELLHISVKDTGIGIAKEYMDKLFQPFRQLNSYQNHEYEGTGLGLAITKKFVEMHGGNIVVISKPGEGSNFIFSIPIEAKYENINDDK
jgi:PAS domain S-box-containing protein